MLKTLFAIIFFTFPIFAISSEFNDPEIKKSRPNTKQATERPQHPSIGDFENSSPPTEAESKYSQFQFSTQGADVFNYCSNKGTTCFDDLKRLVKNEQWKCEENSLKKPWQQFDADVKAEYESSCCSLGSKIANFLKSSYTVYEDNKKIAQKQHERDYKLCANQANQEIFKIEQASNRHIASLATSQTNNIQIENSKKAKELVLQLAENQKIKNEIKEANKKLGAYSYKTLKPAHAIHEKISLCTISDDGTQHKLLYIWQKIDSFSDAKISKMCIENESKLLDQVELNLKHKANGSELKSDSVALFNQANYINKNKINLAAANCVWKALSSLNERLLEIRQSGAKNLDSVGLGLFAGLVDSRSFIDYASIYSNFESDKYNLNSISEKINFGLLEDPIKFKQKYFSTNNVGMEITKQQARKDARERTYKFNSDEEKFMDSYLSTLDLAARLLVPDSLEIIATGSCPTTENPSLTSLYYKSVPAK